MSYFFCMLVVAAHTVSQRSGTAAQHPAILSRGDSSAHFLNKFDALKPLIIFFSNQGASKYIAVSAKIFGCGVQNKINPKLKWKLIDRCGPGVVGYGSDSVLFCQCSNCRD